LSTSFELETVEIDRIKTIRGVPVPADVHFRQILVTGPPGSGKSVLVAKLGGWPEEGYLDLAADNWWGQRLLTYRPREIHFGIPFVGRKESLVVFDEEWLAAPTALDTARIRIPPAKRHWFNIDWLRRYVFDFQLPPVEQIYNIRIARGRAGTHPGDVHLTRVQVAQQVAAYARLALHFQRCGLRIYVRERFEGVPKRIVVRAD
jgi:hypothetical protein